MAKASPFVRGFNAGLFSALMEGRTDLEFYPASLRRSLNCILTPQGPAICRSGTRFAAPVADNSSVSTLKAFVYNNEQAKVLEFSSDRIRFLDEDGIQAYAAAAATISGTSPFKLDIPTVAATVGDDFVLTGFPADYNLNGEIVRVVSAAGTTYTFNRNVSASLSGAGLASKVYAVPIDYTEDERKSLQLLQDVDITYLLCGTKRTRKLSRYGDYDWRLTDVSFVDGPYQPVNDTATVLALSATGNAVPVLTSNTSSGTATGSGKRNAGSAVAAGGTWLGRTYALGLPATDYFHAFDADDDTYWASDTAQKGTLEYQPASAFVCTGYTVYPALDNNDVTYLNTDFAPSTWYFEGYNGTAWVTLDFQENYVQYDHDRSVFFELDNAVSYSRYRIRIIKCVRNGQIEPRIRRLVMRGDSANITLTASSIAGINRDTGFQATDVGRIVRIRGTDNFWRWLIIQSVTNTTTVVAALQNTPFLDTSSSVYWRLGVWSDTTGWPTSGDFFGDRMYLGPSQDSPNVLCGSVVGLYENFTHVEEDGAVLDDGAIVHYIRSPKLSRIKWIISTEKGMVVGTGSQEFKIDKPASTNLTPTNITSLPSTSRGTAGANAVKVDNRVLHVPRSGRSVRELVYSYDSDGYISNNLSRFASHLGAVGFAEQAYANEPHTMDWIRRNDGTIVSLTYNRDEGVVGWGEQDLSGAVVESMLVIPQKDQQQDTLWLELKRTVDGAEKRYIEYLTRPWDFGMTLDDAVFVDSALVYDGGATDTLYGAQHLEGREVYGLARQGDGTELSPYEYLPFGPIVVENGAVVLPYSAEHIVLGLGYESVAETSRLENGATDGTAMAKNKRFNKSGVFVWDSAAGEIGVFDDQTQEYVYTPLEFRGDASEVERAELYTGLVQSTILGQAYSERGSISFRRPIDKPLPLNVVAIAPSIRTFE